MKCRAFLVVNFRDGTSGHNKIFEMRYSKKNPTEKMTTDHVLKLAEAIQRDPLRFERYRLGAATPAFHADSS